MGGSGRVVFIEQVYGPGEHEYGEVAKVIEVPGGRDQLDRVVSHPGRCRDECCMVEAKRRPDIYA